MHTIMALCTILYPRFKFKAVDVMFSMYGHHASRVRKMRNTLHDLLQEYHHKSISRNNKTMGVGSTYFVPTSDADEALKRSSRFRESMKNTRVTTTGDTQVKIVLGENIAKSG